MAGLVLGLSRDGSHLPVIALIVLIVALAATIRDTRATLAAAVLLVLGCAGLLTGISVRQGAALDCRRGWESGAEVRLVVRAIGHLPPEEEGVVRVHPLRSDSTAADTGRCNWQGDLRVLATGPVRPGGLYELVGTWQPSKRPGRGPRSPARSGWLVREELTLLSPPRFAAHPFLSLRGGLADRLWSVYPRRWAPLALALVLGQREAVSFETSRRMGRAGMAHLLAISGLHVGMLAAALFSLARLARLSLAHAHLVTIVLTGLYVALIGAPASAVRAGLMISLWSLSRIAGRASSPFDVLGLAAILLLVGRPWSVTEPGFQLSFAGAAAVGWTHREVSRWRWLREHPAPVRTLSVGLCASLGAVLLTAPISAAYFGRVTPGAVAGTVLALPLLALAMPALFLSALLSGWPAAATWSASAAIPLLWGIDRLARFLSETGWSSFDVRPPTLLSGALYVLLLILVGQAFHGALQRRRLILYVGALWSMAILGPALRLPFVPTGLEVFVLDVGQGDAIAIMTPGRRWLLVDAGPNVPGFDAGRTRVVPFLRERGVRRLEAWVASHPDLDHVGGGVAVLEAVDVERVVGVGRVTGQAGQVAVLRRLAEVDETSWLSVRAGGSLQVDEVKLSFLHPPPRGPPTPGDPAEAPQSANDLSLVFRLDYGDFRMLFTGDLPGEIEVRLALELGEELRAHVLKVSHHGSASSSTGRFLEAVRPGLAVISAGRGNIYGHPSPLVISRLGAHGVDIHRTDREGTLVITAAADGTWKVGSAAQAVW